MCATSLCVMEGSDFSSTCPIGCINNATGKRYEYVGMPKKCSCPIYNCTCSFACRTSDYPKLLAAKRQPLPVDKKSADSNLACTAGLGDIMSNGVRTGFLKMMIFQDRQKLVQTQRTKM